MADTNCEAVFVSFHAGNTRSFGFPAVSAGCTSIYIGAFAQSVSTLQDEVVAFRFGSWRNFVVVVSVLSAQCERAKRNSYANAKLLYGFGIAGINSHSTSADSRCCTNAAVTGNIVRVGFGNVEVVSSANAVLSTLECCSCQSFVAELLNSSAHSYRAASVAHANAIAFCTCTSSSHASNSCFCIVITNESFHAYATEFTSVVNAVGTSSVEIAIEIVTSHQIRSLVIAGDGIHGSVVTTQQHLTEATFQTHHGATIETTSSLVVMSEVASRALSPAVNDPGTAIEVIGRLTRLLALWASAAAEAEPEDGDEAPAYPLVHVPPLREEDLFEDAFMLIGRDGAGMVEIQSLLQKALLRLATLGDAAFRQAALAQADMALERALQALPLEQERQRVQALAQTWRAAHGS